MAIEQNSGNGTVIRNLKIWLNAFIPRDLGEMTKPVLKGIHAGKTMLPGPLPLSNCFLTDQRDFCTDMDAHSRMHSKIEIDISELRLVHELHRCDLTIEINCDSGEVMCQESSTIDRMKFSDFEVSDDKNTISVKIEAAAKNPCFKIANIKASPNVDYHGTLTIWLDNNRQRAHISFEGKIETYPSFEMYTSANDGPASTIFRVEPVPGTTPNNLFGPPTRDISGEVTLTG